MRRPHQGLPGEAVCGLFVGDEDDQGDVDYPRPTTGQDSDHYEEQSPPEGVDARPVCQCGAYAEEHSSVAAPGPPKYTLCHEIFSLS